MTIKSDKWIKGQCTPPTFVKRVLTPQLQNSTCDVYLVPVESWEPTHQTAGELEYEVLANQYTSIGTREFRPLTDAERAAFLPMIEPFEPMQVRSVSRHMTEDEKFDYHQGRALGDPSLKVVGDHLVEQKVLSYGTSSYGYDIRCSREFKIFTNINSTVVDPKAFDDKNYVDVHGDYCIIPPNSFALARTVEYFRIPRNVLAICLGKSTYARCGIIVNVTPLEPEWEGYLTLEFSNTTPLPAKVYAGEGCAQLLFFESDEDCETSYKDRGGKYQNQVDQPVPPKV